MRSIRTRVRVVLKFFLEKKTVCIVYIAIFEMYVDIRCRSNSNEMFCARDKRVQIAWRFDSLSRRSGSNESPKRYSQFWSKAKL